MSDPVFGDEEIQFPQEVHYRIIAEGNAAAEKAVRATAESLGVSERMAAGNASAGGKYQTFALTITATSKEHMHGVDAAFRKLECVKMVI